MKKTEENKMMVNNIKAKMFRGYHQVIKNKKKEIKLEKEKKRKIIKEKEFLKELEKIRIKGIKKLNRKKEICTSNITTGDEPG